MSEAVVSPARCRQAVILAAGEGKRLRPLTEASRRRRAPGTSARTVNLYSLSEGTWQDAYRPALDEAVAAGKLQDYYEAALGEQINAGMVALEAVDFSAERSMEVDDLTDLARAEEQFAPPQPLDPEPS